jgi:GxxExxY protein
MALAHAELTRKIIGAFFKVYNELGHGYSEKVYCRALAIVLREMGLEVLEECEIRVGFHGTIIGIFRADLVVERTILIEVKAGQRIEDWHIAQILNYLKCAGGGVGLLVNFGQSLTHKRYAVGDPSVRLPNLI